MGHTTVTQLRGAFELLYKSLLTHQFRHELRLSDYLEKDLRPVIRAMLLGVASQNPNMAVQRRAPETLLGFRHIDFIIDDIAIDIAVRMPRQGDQSISRITPSGQLRKLLRYKGPSLLVIFDFCGNPYPTDTFQRYRDWDGLRNAHGSLNVLYFFRGGSRPDDASSASYRLIMS